MKKKFRPLRNITFLLAGFIFIFSVPHPVLAPALADKKARSTPGAISPQDKDLPASGAPATDSKPDITASDYFLTNTPAKVKLAKKLLPGAYSLIFLFTSCSFILLLFNKKLRSLVNQRTLELSRVNQKLLQAQYIAKIGDFVWEIKSGNISWSDGMFQLLKYDKGEKIIYQKVKNDIHHPDDLERITRWLKKGISSGQKKLTPNEYRLVCKTGEIIHVQTNVEIDYQHGQAVRLFGTCQDITERIQAEKALRNSEEKYRRVVDFLGVGISVINKKMEVNTVNKELLKWFPDIDVKKKPVCYQIYNDPPRNGPCSYCPCIKTFQDGTPHETITETPAGDKINFFRILATPIKNEKGEVVQVIELTEDLTDQIKSEKEKISLQQKLRQAHKMESLGTLTAGIAHDFNNILGIIIGNTELALDDIPEWNPVHANLKEIKTASLRAADIIKQLLCFNRKTEEELEPTGITIILKEALQLLRSTIPTTIDIRSTISVTNQTILANPVHIKQLIMNLCINAAQEMGETGGLIEITAKTVTIEEKNANGNPDLPEGEYFRLTIRDSGPGIAPEILDRIFDPYFTTKDVGKGSGMGLAMVHGIVKNHNGAITVKSKPGKGTSFSIFLPLAEEIEEIETKTEINAELHQGTETILFVDDEKAIVTMTCQLLKRIGYRVEAHTNPTEAFLLFQSQPDSFDLVITDMTMPKMTGVMLYKKLIKIRKDIPVIICSGHSTLIDEEKAKDMGLAAYVMKPVIKNNIARIIRQVLDKRYTSKGY